MNKLLSLTLLALLTCNLNLSGAENKTEAKISSVVVFMDGAQIIHEAKINLAAGKTLLTFTGLSSNIDKNSIQVSGQGSFTILSVKHSFNYLENAEGNTDVQALDEKIRQLKSQIETKQTEMKILEERKDFLVSNKIIINSDKLIEPANLKLYSDFFATGFKDVELEILSKLRELKDLNDKLKAGEQQLKELAGQQKLPSSEIIVEVDAKQAVTGNFKISYLVTNAGWYPTYDLRVDDIDRPVQLTYKANVHQNSGIDWNNVDVTISNANPYESAAIPTMFPYYLYFNNVYRQEINYSYNPDIREVRGIVTDIETGEPLPFVNIVVKDYTVGTSTDVNGTFSLAIPAGAKTLKFTYIGYEPLEVPIGQSYMNLTLKSINQALEAYEIVEYKAPLVKGKSVDKNESIPLDIKTIPRQTNFEFKIKTPYSIASSSSPLNIELMEIDLESEYIYKSIPKLSEKAYLIALITNWEKYDLLDGEVNLYYENTYVGKSLLDLSQVSDTLEVSLGADKGLTVKREQQKEFSGKQFLGANNIEKRSWKTIVKNNKAGKVSMIIYDQVPVSNNQEIVVEVTDVSQGKLNEETGRVSWEIELEPNSSIDKTIGYSVKYPKGKILKIQ
jgi:hypothetical protein